MESENKEKRIAYIRQLLNYFRDLELSNKLGYATLFIAAVCGFWGITLTYQIKNDHSLIVQNDTLINKTDSFISEQKILDTLSKTQIDSLVSINAKLSKQVNLLTDQYTLSASADSENSYNQLNQRKVNMAELSQAASYIMVELLNVDYKHLHPEEAEDILNDIQKILVQQLNNPFLIENDTLYELWDSHIDNIRDCKLIMHGLGQEMGLGDTVIKSVFSWQNVTTNIFNTMQNVSSWIADTEDMLHKEGKLKNIGDDRSIIIYGYKKRTTIYFNSAKEKELYIKKHRKLNRINSSL